MTQQEILFPLPRLLVLFHGNDEVQFMTKINTRKRVVGSVHNCLMIFVELINMSSNFLDGTTLHSSFISHCIVKSTYCKIVNAKQIAC